MLTKKFIPLTLLFLELLVQLPQVSAQSFSKKGTPSLFSQDTFIPNQRTDFNNTIDLFIQDLSSKGDRMTESYSNMRLKLAQTQNLESQTNINNNKTSEQAFQNGESQALNSGGLYNTPGHGVFRNSGGSSTQLAWPW